MRPKLGSPPCSAVFTSGELAIERATGSTASGPPLDHDPADAPGALAVGDHLEGELAQQRVHRLAEAQLVVALRLDPHARGAVGEREHGVAGGQLAVDRDAVERALDAHAGEQVERLGAQLGVGLHEAEHRGEARRIMPAPLACAARRTRPPRELDLEAGALGPAVAGQDRLGEVRRVVAQRSRRRRARRSTTVSRGSSMPDHAGRGHPHLRRLDAQLARRRPPASRAAVSTPRWPSPTFEPPELADHRAQAVEVGLARDDHRRAHAARWW